MASAAAPIKGMILIRKSTNILLEVEKTGGCCNTRNTHVLQARRYNNSHGLQSLFIQLLTNLAASKNGKNPSAGQGGSQAAQSAAKG
jgi:hypothetical protein